MEEEVGLIKKSEWGSLGQEVGLIKKRENGIH